MTTTTTTKRKAFTFGGCGGLLDRWADVVATRPCAVFWTSLIVASTISVVPFVAYSDGFSVDFTNEAFQVRGNDVSETQLAIEALERAPHEYRPRRRRRRQRRLNDEDGGYQHRATKYSSFRVCPQGEERFVDAFVRTADGDDDLLTPENVARARELQDALARLPTTRAVHLSPVTALSDAATAGRFDDELARTASCAAEGSLASDCPAWALGNCDLDDDENGNSVWNWSRPGRVLCDERGDVVDYVDGAEDDGVRAYFGRDFSSCAPKSPVARIVVQVCERGWDMEDRHGTYEDWRRIAESVNGVVLVWSDYDYFDYEQERVMTRDAMLFGAAVPLVFLVICLQTRSLFLSVVGVLSITASFGSAYFVYRTVLGISYFHFLNFLGFFILLGINADDIFVTTDAWKQSAVVHERAALKARMRSTLSRAVPAILATSLTTAAAFFGNIISNIPPLRLFGMITGFMVVFDWLLTVTLFASALILHERYVCRRRSHETGTKSTAANNDNVIESDAEERSPDNDNDDAEERPPTNDAPPKYRWLEDRFADSYVPWLVRRAPIVLLLATAVVGAAANLVLNLEPLVEEPSLYPKGHNQYREHHLRQSILPRQTWPVYVELVYGVKKGDNSERLNPNTSENGYVTLEPSFDMSSPAAQRFFLETCEALNSEQRLVRSVEDCFAFQFRDYVRDVYTGGSFPYECGSDDGGGGRDGIGFPVTADNFADAMRCFDQSRYQNSENKYGLDENGVLRWATIRVRSRLEASASIGETERAHGEWREWVNAREAAGEDSGLGKPLFIDQNGLFLTASTVTELQSGALKAITLSIALTLLVIGAATRHVRITLFAVFSVVTIVLCTVALMVLLGYKLGVLESMALSILVGVSIDYTVHLALAYMEAKAPEDEEDDSRYTVENRMRDACRHAGISVFSGAFTTSLAGFVLLFATITFFTTFGLFILSTALLSIVSALTVFTSLCVLFLKERDAFPKRTFAAFAILVLASVISVVVRLVHNERANGVEPLTTEIKTMNFTFPPHTLSSEKTQYLCSSFVLPRTAHVQSIEVVDRMKYEGMMHHMLLLSSVRDFGTCPFRCMDMPDVTGFHWAWAVGAPSLQLPSNLHMAFENVMVLQIHYDNFLGENVTDAGSGLVVTYTDAVPMSAGNDATSSIQEVGTVTFGSHPDGDWEIPPHVQNNTLVFETRIQLLDRVRVRGWTLHMHRTGVRGRLEIIRDGAFVSFLGCVGYANHDDRFGVDPRGVNGCLRGDYDFDYQVEIALDDDDADENSVVVLEPGDVLRQTCEMDTRNMDHPVRSGYATDEEMCQTFISAYPKKNVVQSFALMTEATLIVSDSEVVVDRRQTVIDG